MPRTSLHDAEPSDPAPPELAPHLDRLHSNLTLVARVIVQLERRIKRLEEAPQRSGFNRFSEGWNIVTRRPKT